MSMNKTTLLGILLALVILAIPSLLCSLLWGIPFWASYICSIFGSALLALFAGAIDMINYRNAKKKI